MATGTEMILANAYHLTLRPGEDVVARLGGLHAFMGWDGPLLTDSRIGFVKGFYKRPLKFGTELLTAGGGRVTELTARPVINLFYPELSGLLQPLSGEYAGRRELLEQLPFFTGYGVEMGMLIDILESFGLNRIVSGLSRGQLNIAELVLTGVLACGFTVVIAQWGTRAMGKVVPHLSQNLRVGEAQFAMAMCQSMKM